MLVDTWIVYTAVYFAEVEPHMIYDNAVKYYKVV